MKIYCDMDGVLADFEKHVNESFKHYFTDKLPFERFNDFKDDIKYRKNFWLDIPKMHDSTMLIEYLKNYNFEILTAYASWDKRSIRDKKIWYKNHFGNQKVNCVQRKEKQNFAHSKSILIDDYEKNIKEFTNAGGIAIFHKSAKETIKQLREYL